jgi:phosphoribosylglycinamide formyltransferase 1
MQLALLNFLPQLYNSSAQPEVKRRQANPQSMEDFQSTVRIAIFASGKGSNTQNIIDYFRHSQSVKVALVGSNKPEAGVLAIAREEKIPALLIEKEKFFRGDAYLGELREKKIDVIVLAGFLWKLPSRLIHAYPKRIINIHPALLPKFGGKGMYGAHVHQAVLDAREKQSGITIHFVDELYDHGQIIFQATCPVDPSDTAESLADKIRSLERAHFPRVIEQWIGMQNIVKR